MRVRKKHFLIYALHHEHSRSIYVGRSSKGLQRPKDHGASWHMKRYSHYPVVKWIVRQREITGKDYEIAVLEECSSANALNDAERFHIAYLRSLGIPLLNCTDGGDGISGHRFSDATRARMSITRKGRTLSAEARIKLSIANRGKKMSPDAIARTAAAHRGKIVSAETRRRMSESHKGKTLPIEQRLKLAAANRRRVYARGWKQSPEAIAKSAAGHRGLKYKKHQKELT